MRPRTLVPATLAVATVALALRLLELVRRFTVDLLYWDQWGFLEPFFSHTSLWTRFSWQHGPHRQGLAALVYSVFLPLTSWSGRAEAFLALLLIAASCLLAFRTTTALFGSVSLLDVAIPLALFSPASFELFLGGQNLANGPLPVLLCFTTAALVCLSSPAVRSLGLAATAFFATFTGFAFVLVPLVAVLLLAELKRESRNIWLPLAGLGIVLAGTALFFSEYKLNPAAACFRFPHTPLLDYARFVSGMSGRAWGTFLPSSTGWFRTRSALALGLFLAQGLAALFSLAGLLRPIKKANPDPESPRSSVVFVLCGFSVGYILLTAVGRVCLGFDASLASRYVLYSAPGIVGLLLASRGIPSVPLRRATGIAIMAILLAKERGSHAEWGYAGWMGERRAAWVDCYLDTRSVAGCDTSTGFPVYPPEDRDRCRIVEKLDFLEENYLSLFAPPRPRFDGGRRAR